MVESFLAGSVWQASSLSGEGTTWIGWALAFIMVVGVAYLVAQPVLVIETGKKRVRLRQLSDAQIELETLHEKAAAERLSLNELEFDKELGIIDPADYDMLKERTGTRLKTLERAIFERQEEVTEAERERREKIAAKRKAKETPQAAIGVAEVAETPQEPKKRAAIRDNMRCSECETPFKPGDRFCSNCKAPLPLVCQKCGAEMDQEARFCSRCGNDLARQG